MIYIASYVQALKESVIEIFNCKEVYIQLNMANFMPSYLFESENINNRYSPLSTGRICIPLGWESHHGTGLTWEFKLCYSILFNYYPFLLSY